MLGDRIGIMIKGKLRALGNAVHLKNLFGCGYRLTLICEPYNLDRLKSLFAAQMPEAKLEDDSAGALIYEIPMMCNTKIPTVVDWIEQNAESLSTRHIFNANCMRSQGLGHVADDVGGSLFAFGSRLRRRFDGWPLEDDCGIALFQGRSECDSHWKTVVNPNDDDVNI